MNVADRAAGAVIGALIGDALGLGPHWYYDLTELRKDYGNWITGYTDPKPGRYHAGMKAGQLSQSGLILVLLLRSIVEKRGLSGRRLYPSPGSRAPSATWTEHQCTAPAVTPINLSGKPIGDASSKSLIGAGPEDTPIPPKPRRELSSWPPVMLSILQQLARDGLSELQVDSGRPGHRRHDDGV